MILDAFKMPCCSGAAKDSTVLPVNRGAHGCADRLDAELAVGIRLNLKHLRTQNSHKGRSATVNECQIASENKISTLADQGAIADAHLGQCC
jgi:hypothetical protein